MIENQWGLRKLRRNQKMDRIAIIYQDCSSASQWGIEEFDNVEDAKFEFAKHWTEEPSAMIIEYKVIESNNG